MYYLNQTLTNKQIAFLYFVATVGYAVISIPKNISDKAETGGWIVLIIGFSIMFVFACMYIYLSKYFEGKTIDEYMPLLTGKYISYALLIGIVLYEVISYSLIARLTSEIIKISMLLNTPIWVLSVFLLAIPFYNLTKDLKAIGRVSQVLGMIIAIFGISILITVFTQGEIINVKPLFPIFEIDYIGALLVVGYSLTGIELFSVIPINNKKNKNIYKYIFFIIILICFVYILVVESCISVMGVDSVIDYDEALFATIRRVEIPQLQFLKRLDGLFLIIWLLSIYCTILTQGYMATYLATKLVKSNKKNIVLLIILIVSIAICVIPPSIQSAKTILDNIAYFGIFINTLLPLILFVMALFYKYKKKSI